MLFKTILNHVQYFKGFVYQNANLLESYNDWTFSEPSIVVEIRSRKGSRGICGCCRQKGSGYDRLPTRLYKHLPILGLTLYFAYSRRRIDCSSCGVKAEEVPWASGNRQLTETFCWYLASWAKVLSWKEVANRFSLGWDSVFGAVERAVEWGLENRSLDNIHALGVDEIARAKGHRYLTLVYQLDKGRRRLLWIGNDRTKSTFHGFFDWFGPYRSDQIKAICSDQWKAYLNVIKNRIPNAIHILDRFHIVANMNKALDKVRIEEAKRMRADGYEPILTNTKWLLLRRSNNLTENQRTSLNELLEYNIKAVKAYILKEEFQRLWEYTSAAWAEKFIDAWCKRVMYSQIEPMKKQAESIRRHKHLILNWFKAKKEFSSGIVEGLNLKAKLTSRKAYGFKSVEVQKIALYHALGDLPTPEWPHKFTG